jgi:hypothetical protein
MIYIILILLLVITIIFPYPSPSPTPTYSVPETIFCSLTTIPERMEKLEKTLKSIRNQSLNPTHIILNIPQITRKGKTYDKEKISNLANKYKVFLNVIEKDLGPITKVIPTLEFVKPGDKIFLIDDDTVYDKNTLKRLYDAKLPAVGFYGRKDLAWYENKKDTPIQMDFLETYGGVLYDSDILMGLKPSEICTSQDDIVIGKHIKDLGVNVFIINNKGIRTKSSGAGTPQLRDENIMGDGNKICYEKLFT